MIRKKKSIILVLIPVILITMTIFIGIDRSFHQEPSFSSDSLTFAAIGDPHYGWTSEQYADEIVNAWIEDDNLPAIEFGINIGDFTHFGTQEGYKVAMQSSFNNFLMPWMFVYGNHDTADYKTDTGRDIYGDGWGLQETELHSKPYDAIENGKKSTGVMGRNYAFLWDNILFLVFGDQGTTMLLTNEQRQWLEYMTNLYPDKTTITVSHQGFGPETRMVEAYRYYNDLEWWDNFISNNPQLALHIHGHNHKFSHYQYHGLDVIDVGLTNGMGKPWTVYFEITQNSISAKVYDVLTREWVKPHFFQKVLNTRFENKGVDWYSYSHRLQDGQIVVDQNRILAERYTLQLIGSGSELVQQNEKFSFYGERMNLASIYYGSKRPLAWIGYEDDSNNGKVEGQIIFNGKDQFSTSTSPVLGNQFNLGWYTKWEEGKVPDSTTPIAIAGKEYDLKAKLKSDVLISNAMDISITVLGKNLSTIIMPKTPILKNLTLTENYQWYKGTFTIPSDSRAWIMKTTWESKQEGSTCYLDEWSLTRADASEYSQDFKLEFNGHEYSHYDNLARNDYAEFNLEPALIQPEMIIKPIIDGSHVGFYRVIYHDPLFWSDDLAIGHLSFISGSEYSCRLELLSPSHTPGFLSLSPFGKESYSLSSGTKYTCKGNYEAWVFSEDELMDEVKITLLESGGIL